MPLPPYIQKRRLRFYAVMEIPAALRRQFGKPRFVLSLGTDSLSAAKRRVGPVVDQWKADIDRARAGLPGGASGTDGSGDDAAFFRRALRSARTEAKRDQVLEDIVRVADEIGMMHVDEIGQAPSSAPEARAFYAAATGQVVPTLEHLDEWQAASNSTAKTKSQNRSDVSRFAVAFPVLSDVQRQPVRKWLGTLAQDEQLQARTIKRILGSIRTYWRWLQSAGVVSETDEPLDKMEVARLSRGRAGAADLRQPFEPPDVPRLLAAALARGDGKLADLITLGMWSGARIAELTALRCSDVNGDSFKIAASKTAAGVRVVPIHPELRPVMARLVRDSKDGFVLSGLSADKYGARSDAIGKRFGALRLSLGHGPALVFHSLRKTVITILENEGVPENIVASIVGHEVKTITYGLYSGGATLAVKQAAIARLSYPAGDIT